MPISNNLRRLGLELQKSCTMKDPRTMPLWALGRKKKKKDVIRRWNIVRGDKVAVVNGHCEGQRGKVIKVFRDKNLVVVEGVNVRRRMVDDEADPAGDRIPKDVPCPIHYSNVNLVCPITNQPTRVQRRYLQDGTKVRVAVRSGAHIPMPEWERNTPRPAYLLGENDTTEDLALQVTYDPQKDCHQWATGWVDGNRVLLFEE